MAVISSAGSLIEASTPSTTSSQPGEHAPDGDIRQEGATYLNEAFEAYDALTKLDQLAAQAHGSMWSHAVNAALALCDRFGDHLCREADDLFITVRRQVHARVMKWPAEGLAAYVRRVSPPTAVRLDQARGSNDIDSLIRIAEDYYPTAHAADAIEAAAAIAFEAGDFALVQQWISRLLVDHPQLDERRTKWESMLAVAIDAGGLGELSPTNRPLIDSSRQLVDYNRAFARNAFRNDYVANSALAEALLWKCESLGSTTLVEPGGSDPLADPASSNARALLTGRLCAFEPIIAHGRVIVHDHRTVWAIDPADPDRPAWQFAIQHDKDEGQPWISEDEPPPQFTSTAHGDRLFVHLERRPPDRFGADPSHPPASVLVCLDAATGRYIWSTDLSNWAAEFEEARLDGAPLVVRDKVIAIARRRKPFGFEACYLVGMALDDGRILFATHIGEAATGGLGFRRATISHPSADGDLIFVHSNLGTVAAASAASGEVCWLREYEPTGNATAAGPGVARGGPQARSWQYQPSIIWRDRVVVAPLDLDRLLILDQATGRIVSNVALTELKNPEELVGIHGDRLYAVGASIVCYGLKAGRVVWERQLPDGELFGRAALSSEGVFVPTTAALLRFPMDGGAPQSRNWAIPAAGNVVIATAEDLRQHVTSHECTPALTTGSRFDSAIWPDQVIVASALKIYGLAGRDAAFARFDAAMEARPDDPAAALAVADLAFSTRDYSKGLAALTAALERAGGPARLHDAGLRRRLFNACLAYADAQREDVSQSGNEIRVLQQAGEIALEPLDQVAYRRKLADALARHGKSATAVAVWQQILSDASLASVRVADDRLAADTVGYRRNDGAADIGEAASAAPNEAMSTTAGELARRAIDDLIAKHGPQVYSDIEKEAGLRLDAARRAGDAAALLRIAEAYPNGRVAMTARLERANVLSASDLPAEAAAAFRVALQAGPGLDRPMVMRSLIDCLLKANHGDAAAAWLDRAARLFPEYRFERQQGRIGFAEYRKLVAGESDPGRSLPMPGTRFKRAYQQEFSDTPLVLHPDAASPRGVWDVCLTYSDGKIEAHRVSDNRSLWPAPVVCRMPPTLLAANERTFILATRHQVLAIDRATGRTAWKLGEYPADADAPGVDPEWIAAWSFHALTHDRIYSALDRNEIVCADRADGSVRWRVPTTQKVSSDLIATDDALAYVTRDDRGNGIVVMDPESGRVRCTFTVPDERTIQRLLPGPNRALVALSAHDVFAIDLSSGRLLWRAPGPARLVAKTACVDSESLCIGTDDGRVVSFHLDSGRQAWAAQVSTRPGDSPLWLALASDKLFVVGPGVLSALDSFDGQVIWKAADDAIPDDPFDPVSPRLTGDGVLTVVNFDALKPRPAGGGPKPAESKQYAVRIFSPEPPDAPPKLAHAFVRLGACTNLRGVFAYNAALIVVDGHRLIGYVAAD